MITMVENIAQAEGLARLQNELFGIAIESSVLRHHVQPLLTVFIKLKVGYAGDGLPEMRDAYYSGLTLNSRTIIQAASKGSFLSWVPLVIPTHEHNPTFVYLDREDDACKVALQIDVEEKLKKAMERADLYGFDLLALTYNAHRTQAHTHYYMRPEGNGIRQMLNRFSHRKNFDESQK